MSDYIVYKIIEQKDIDELEIFYSTFSIEDTKDLLFDFKNELFFKVVNKDNEIVGIASVADDDYTYNNLKRFVIPEMRGKKIADLLLDEIIKTAKSENKLRLIGLFKSENEKAKKYFTEKGFKTSDFGTIETIKYSSAKLKLK